MSPDIRKLREESMLDLRKLCGPVAAFAMALSVAVPAQAQPEFTLRWAHYLPNNNFLEVEKNFAAAIEERTNGRVKIDITYAGGLGSGKEVLTLAGRGAVDIASAIPGDYPDHLLFWRAYQLPFVFDSPAQAISVSSRSYQELPYFKQELDRLNVQFLFQQALGSYYLTGPSESCDSVAGLSSKKLRSFGAYVPQLHTAIGAVPVTISTTEIYEALQRGTIDYSFLNRGNILSNRWHEVGKYSCGPIMSVAGHIIVIGKRTWERLPTDIQAIFIEEAGKSQQAFVEWADVYETEAMRTIEAEGGVFKEFPDSELARWREAAPDLLAQWVADMERRGTGDEAREVADRWREIVAE